MSFFTFLLLILISPDCQAQVKCLHMALHRINATGQVQKWNKISEMGPEHEYVFGLKACVGVKKEEKSPQPTVNEWWCSLPHGREHEPSPGSTSRDRSPPSPKMSHLPYQQRLRGGSLCPLRYDCTTFLSVAVTWEKTNEMWKKKAQMCFAV